MFSVLLFCMLVYLGCTAFSGYMIVKKLKSAAVTEAERTWHYQVSFTRNTVSGASVLLIVGVTPLTWEQVGLCPVRFQIGEHFVIMAGTFLVCGVFLVFVIGRTALLMASGAYRDFVSKDLEERAKNAGPYGRVAWQLIPRSNWEKEWFVIAALSAGVCEELLFRGFGLCILRGIWVDASGFLLAVVAGFGFGAVYFYRGLNGALRAGISGTLLGFVYLGAQSVYPCMLVHFILHVFSVFLHNNVKAGNVRM